MRTALFSAAMPTAWRDRLIIIAPFVGVLLLAGLTPSDDGSTICPFALCTGTACPGCGMTRAASHLIRGDFATAMGYHPLVPLVIVQLVAAWAWFVLRRAGRAQPLSSRTINVILIATTGALLLVWVARLLSGTLPPV